jgi:predicted transcriptional regulator
MTHMNRLTDAVQQALVAVPNVSALAKEAGVSQSLLARIQAGERQATPAVAAKVAAALIRWGKTYNRAASRIRQAQARGSR